MQTAYQPKGPVVKILMGLRFEPSRLFLNLAKWDRNKQATYMN